MATSINTNNNSKSWPMERPVTSMPTRDIEKEAIVSIIKNVWLKLSENTSFQKLLNSSCYEKAEDQIWNSISDALDDELGKNDQIANSVTKFIASTYQKIGRRSLIRQINEPYKVFFENKSVGATRFLEMINSNSNKEAERCALDVLEICVRRRTLDINSREIKARIFVAEPQDAETKALYAILKDTLKNLANDANYRNVLIKYYSSENSLFSSFAGRRRSLVKKALNDLLAHDDMSPQRKIVRDFLSKLPEFRQKLIEIIDSSFTVWTDKVRGRSASDRHTRAVNAVAVVDKKLENWRNLEEKTETTKFSLSLAAKAKEILTIEKKKYEKISQIKKAVMRKQSYRSASRRFIRLFIKYLKENPRVFIAEALKKALEDKKIDTRRDGSFFKYLFMRNSQFKDIFISEIRETMNLLEVSSSTRNLETVLETVSGKIFKTIQEQYEKMYPDIYEEYLVSAAKATGQRLKEARNNVRNNPTPEGAVEQDNRTVKKSGIAPLDTQLKQIGAERVRAKKAAEAKDGKEVKRDGLPEGIKTDASIKGAERK